MVEALGMSLIEVIFAIANFLILVGVLTKFLYKPLLTMLENRKNAIKESFDNAEAMNRKAEEKMASYSKQIANVEAEGREIIKNAKQKAEEQAQQIIDEANAKAGEILLAAEREIQREQAKALADMKEYVASLALLAAEKILEKDIQMEGQDGVIDNILKQAGEGKWLN